MSKYYPFKPLKLTELANVRCLARHNGFRDSPIQFVNAMCSIGPLVGLTFKTVIPKSLQGTRLNELPTRDFFSSIIYLLAAFDHGVNSSICFK